MLQKTLLLIKARSSIYIEHVVIKLIFIATRYLKYVQSGRSKVPFDFIKIELNPRPYLVLISN